MTKTYNVVKSAPDARDYQFSQKVSIPKSVPSAVDLRPHMPTVVDQGNLGSCTANAIVAAFQYDLTKQKLNIFTGSRLFVYYNERVMEGSVGQDSGAMIRDGIKSLNTYGVCSEPTWPYIIAKFAVKPSTAAYTQAKLNRALTYYSVASNPTAIKTALAAGFPVVIGIEVYESFESDAVAVSGVVPMPGPSEQLLGGHAVLVVGYNDVLKQFIVRNSWGTGWGKSGYFFLPYAYTSLMSDCWVVSSVN
jgi:C1A family cysteine protease